MDDSIGRAEAQTAIQFAARRYMVAHEAHGEGQVVWSDNLINVTDAMNVLRDLPSAQPEQRWILCSERMPEEHEWIGTKHFGTTISDEVYVTFEAPDGQRFTDHISFQNGKLSASDAERMRVWYKGAKPVAWMPLPEPWKGEEDEAD